MPHERCLMNLDGVKGVGVCTVVWLEGRCQAILEGKSSNSRRKKLGVNLCFKLSLFTANSKFRFEPGPGANWTDLGRRHRPINVDVGYGHFARGKPKPARPVNVRGSTLATDPRGVLPDHPDRRPFTSGPNSAWDPGRRERRRRQRTATPPGGRVDARPPPRRPDSESWPSERKAHPLPQKRGWRRSRP
jgi:hypothetical protein